MSQAVIIVKRASELRIGDRIMETDGGGLWYHVATVSRLDQSLLAIGDRFIETIDPKAPKAPPVAVHVSPRRGYYVEVIV